MGNSMNFNERPTLVVSPILIQRVPNQEQVTCPYFTFCVPFIINYLLTNYENIASINILERNILMSQGPVLNMITTYKLLKTRSPWPVLQLPTVSPMSNARATLSPMPQPAWRLLLIIQRYGWRMFLHLPKDCICPKFLLNKSSLLFQ